MTPNEMEETQVAMGYDSSGRPYMPIIYQWSGDVITIPPGWLHCVFNLQPCLKIAFDYFEPHQLPSLIDSWTQIASPYLSLDVDL